MRIIGVQVFSFCPATKIMPTSLTVPPHDPSVFTCLRDPHNSRHTIPQSSRV